MKQPRLVQSSSEENPSQVAMQREIDELRKQLNELSLGFEYLATTNMELVKDMQAIYESLKDVSAIVNGDNLYSPFRKYINHHDDDLPN